MSFGMSIIIIETTYQKIYQKQHPKQKEQQDTFRIPELPPCWRDHELKKKTGGWEQRLLWPPRSNMHQPANWIVDSKAPKTPNGDIGPEDSIIMKCPKSPTDGPTERSPKKPWATKIPPLYVNRKTWQRELQLKIDMFQPWWSESDCKFYAKTSPSYRPLKEFTRISGSSWNQKDVSTSLMTFQALFVWLLNAIHIHLHISN